MSNILKLGIPVAASSFFPIEIIAHQASYAATYNMRQVWYIIIHGHAAYYLAAQINNSHKNEGNRDATALEACKGGQHDKGKHYAAGTHQMNISVKQCRSKSRYHAGQKNKFTNKLGAIFFLQHGPDK